jgi:TolB-like protein
MIFTKGVPEMIGKKRTAKAIIRFLLFFLTATSVHGQNIVTLDEAVQNAVDYFRGRIPQGSKILPLNFSSDSGDLSDYVIDKLTEQIVNDGVFIVVDRSNLALLQEELHFQLSGEVNDETAVSVGRKLGAQSIILGSIRPLGDIYRLQVRAIEVETARIQGMVNINVMQDPIMAALTGKSFSGSQSRWLANQAFGSELWKNKRFYAGIRPGVSVSFYNIENGEYSGRSVNNGVSFDIAAHLAIQMHPLFAFQIELIGTADSAAISDTADVTDETGNFLYRYETMHVFDYRSMIIPVLAKLTLRPDIYFLGLFGGAYFSFPLGSINYTDSFSGRSEKRTAAPNPGWVAGANAGIKLGPGVIFLDMRYMADFNMTKVQGDGRVNEIFRRGMAAFSIGYEIGFVNLKK